ncbi:hypothetical protein BT69DRAFT_1283489 [Atractiella rhizophila]|nr:hypothetical protein BT69DRAFT_1283489 [Atractiella rhizophila]
MAHALCPFLYLSISFDWWATGQRHAVVQQYFNERVHSARVLITTEVLKPNRIIFPNLQAIGSNVVSQQLMEQMRLENVPRDKMLETCRRYGMER